MVVAAGGTGGHVFPALAIAEELRILAPTAECWFAGTRDRIEARVVPQQGYPFFPIWISGFQRRKVMTNVLVPIKIMVALVQSLLLLRRLRPDVVLGTGGYVCGPVVAAASLLGIPAFIHESNSYPGITTKLLARRVRRIFTAFDAAARWLPRNAPIVKTGTPVRKALLRAVDRSLARTSFGLDPEKPTLLILGGSLGAASLNTAAQRALDRFSAAGIQAIWQTGPAHLERIRSALGNRPSVWIGPFIDSMEKAYAAADLVVSRAGATTLAELTALGKPSVLVPYPFAAEDHQTINARTLADAGAAILLADRDAAEHLAETVLSAFSDRSRLQAMGEAARRLGSPEAATVIARELLHSQH